MPCHYLCQSLKPFEEIHSDIESTTAISEEQAISIDQISHRMVLINDMQDNIYKYGTSTSDAVYQLSQELNVFRLDTVSDSNVELSFVALLQLSKADHILWKWRIYNMLLGLETVLPEDVGSKTECRLGQWYDKPEVKEALSHLAAYKQLDSHHEDVHKYAKEAAIHFQRGDVQAAENDLKHIERASIEVLRLLDELLEYIK